MFTVVICGEKLHTDCTQKYGEFLAPFLKSKEFAFCEWNHMADSIDEAVPDLKDLIRNKNDWRVIVVLDKENYGIENISKYNPYNYNDSCSKIQVLNTAEEVALYRETWTKRYETAIQNPLTKLSLWLMGTPISECLELPEEYQGLLDEINEEEMRKLEQREDRITAAEVELERLLVLKGNLLNQHFAGEGELENKPKQFIVLCERMHVNDNEACDRAWGMGQEHAYSNFFEDNFYAGRMRCLVCDVDYIKGERAENSYFNFLSAVMMFATNEISGEKVRQGKMYAVEVDVDNHSLSQCYSDYLEKLKLTLGHIEFLKRKYRRRKQEPVPEKELYEEFLAEEKIPVEVDHNYDRNELICESEKLGLANDCPQDEKAYWDDQYFAINKKFIRYLREPRRAVKTAVAVDFRDHNKVEDERASALNEFQREEIQIRLEEEEEAMVKVDTSRIFQTKEYTDRLSAADKEVRKELSQRLSRKQTLYVGGIAVSAYLFGFLPLLISNFNTVKSFSFSLFITVLAISIFAVAGIVCLIVLRYKLVKKFRDFNQVMKSILREIEEAMERFSEYLSHACNVMREFSVVESGKKSRVNKEDILRKHEFYITEQTERVADLFAGTICLDEVPAQKIEPYQFDFTKDCKYAYNIESVCTPGKAIFVDPEQKVEVPCNYIKAVLVTREELYD